MKNKGKFYVIDLPIYNIDIALSIDQRARELRKCLLEVWDHIPEKYLPDDMTDNAAGQTLCLEWGNAIIPYCIRLRENPLKVDDCLGFQTIAHEVYHVVFRILTSRGIEPCFETEEAYAYLTGHLTREIYKRL